MSRIAVFFLQLIVLILAMLLALLGVETIPTNPIGWQLLLVGVAFIARTIIVYSNRKECFWESALGGAAMHEERGDRSYWLIILGMIAVFFSSPIEYIYLSTLIHDARVLSFGFSLVTLGVVLFVWARRTLGLNYLGHFPAENLQKLVKSGPYRFIHHPDYAGILFMAVGIGLGYSSFAGLFSVFALLLPGLIKRMNMEEKLLAEQLGDAYRQYVIMVNRLIPCIW